MIECIPNEEVDIEYLYSKYGPMVLRRCRYLLKNEEKALDAMHDVFVQLLKDREKIHLTYPSSFLFRITTNLCLKIIQKEKRYSEVDSNTQSYRLASLDNFEDRLMLREIINKIFENEKISTREIAEMLIIDGMTLKGVSKETGLSVSGIRKRLRKIKKKAIQIKNYIYDE
jgi:RNA polymerase sigma-70 factor (ECF subfamily)